MVKTPVPDGRELTRIVDDPGNGIGEFVRSDAVQNDIRDEPLAGHILVPGLGVNNRREEFKILANIVITDDFFVIFALDDGIEDGNVTHLPVDAIRRVCILNGNSLVKATLGCVHGFRDVGGKDVRERITTRVQRHRNAYGNAYDGRYDVVLDGVLPHNFSSHSPPMREYSATDTRSPHLFITVTIFLFTR